MRRVNVIAGRVAPYAKGDVDTDEIVPARFMSRDRSAGFKDTLFRDLRLDDNGAERADFVLNRPEYRDPVVLVVGRNFGCGSSREHAVWALQDYGIGCVIAISYGDIFRNNALENGLLPIALPADKVAALQDAVMGAAPCEMTVDLAARSICGPDGIEITFEFDPHEAENLMKGLSKVDATLARSAEIEAFEHRHRQRFPWLR